MLQVGTPDRGDLLGGSQFPLGGRDFVGITLALFRLTLPLTLFGLLLGSFTLLKLGNLIARILASLAAKLPSLIRRNTLFGQRVVNLLESIVELPIYALNAFGQILAG